MCARLYTENHTLKTDILREINEDIDFTLNVEINNVHASEVQYCYCIGYARVSLEIQYEITIDLFP